MYDPRELQPGDVLLMTSRRVGVLSSLLDALIMWSEGNPFVHAAICGQDALIDPVWRVTLRPLDYYASHGWVLRPACPEEVRRRAADWARARVGDPYGIGELLEDGVRFDLHFVAHAWYRLHRRRYTCSGFVAEAYAQAGVRLTLAPLPAPSDLSYSPLLAGRRPWEPPPRRRAAKPGTRAASPSNGATPRREPLPGGRRAG